MLRDPEQEPETWDEPVLANNPTEAKRQCERLAEQYNVTLDSVKSPRIIQNRNQVYRCIFIGEKS